MAVFTKLGNDIFAGTGGTVINSEVQTWSTEVESAVADLRDWSGLDLTDTNDNSTLLQAAITQVSSTGEALFIPAGKIALGSEIVIGDSLRLVGSSQAGRDYASNHTFFHIGHTGVGFRLKNTAGAIELDRINTYRTQPAITVGWAPTAHDWDVLIEGGQDVAIRNSTFLNPTKMISATGDTAGAGRGCGRIILDNIKGQPLLAGIDFTHCYDVVYFDNMHLWPFWSEDANVTDKVRATAVSYRFGRIDNPKFGRIFSWGYNIGMRFSGQLDVGLPVTLPAGSASKFKADITGLDNCNFGILFDGDGDNSEVTIDEVYAASDPSRPAISVSPFFSTTAAISGVRAKIGKFNGQQTTSALVDIRGTDNNLIIGDGSSSVVGSAAGADYFCGAGNELTLMTPPKTSATAAYNNGGTGIIRTPDWRSYTPVVTATTGTLTTVSATGKYRRQGNTVAFSAKITLTTNGTGSGSIRFTLPTTIAVDTIGQGREQSITGKMLSCTLSNATAVGVLVYYDNTYPGADGTIFTVAGEYEV